MLRASVALPFVISNAALIATQAALVAAPRPATFVALSRLRGPAWALIPAASIVAAVYGIEAYGESASGLTWLALIAVPPLAFVAFGSSMRGARWALAPVAVPLFALAWIDRTGLIGEAAAVCLSALACVTLASALSAVTPTRWLKAGVIAMAVADAVLVFSEQLQAPNDVLNAAAPPAGLPQLQEAHFGTALMGFGDLFLAAVLGAIVAQLGWRPLRAALTTLVLAAAFDLLFFAVDELPATVPIALTLLVLSRSEGSLPASRRERGRRSTQRAVLTADTDP